MAEDSSPGNGDRERFVQGGCSTLPQGALRSGDGHTGAAGADATGPKPRKKIALKPGFSQMDWMRLTASGRDLTGQGGPTTRPITLEEVRKHSSHDDAWMVFRGMVYNITPYLEFHPGGVDELLRGAGVDGTPLFDEIHPWVNAEYMLAKCCVGTLASDDSCKEATAAPVPPVTGAVGSSVPSASSLGVSVTLPSTSWTECTLLWKKPASTSGQTVLLRLELPRGMKTGWVQAVQHVLLRFTLPDGTEIQRPYTPVSPLSQQDSFDLAVKVYPGGKMGEYLSALDIGASVSVKHRASPLVYSRNCLEWGGSKRPTSKICFVGGGTGITPLFQLARHILDDATSVGYMPPHLYIVSAHRTLSDALLAQETAALATLSSRVHVTFVASSVSSAADGGSEAKEVESSLQDALECLGSTVKTGRVCASMLREVLPPPEADVAIVWCGPPGFGTAVDDACRQLYYLASNFFGFEG